MSVQTKQASAEVLAQLIQAFSQTAAERDKLGGTAKKERDLIRNSGLLRLTFSEELGGYEKGW